MRIKCKASFPSNSDHQFGFYGLPGEAGRRIYQGQEFLYEFGDKDEVIEREGRLFIKAYGWMEALEAPKKKPGPKPKEETVVD